MPFPSWYSRIRYAVVYLKKNINFQKSPTVSKIHNKHWSHLAGYVNESTVVRFSEFRLDFCSSWSGKWSRVWGVASFHPSLPHPVVAHGWCSVEQHFSGAPDTLHTATLGRCVHFEKWASEASLVEYSRGNKSLHDFALFSLVVSFQIFVSKDQSF